MWMQNPSFCGRLARDTIYNWKENEGIIIWIYYLEIIDVNSQNNN